MVYDANMDKALFSEIVEFETTRITVSVFSYNNGTPKLQISRENMDPDGTFKFAKLGRMIKEEAEKVVPLMAKALEQM
jgi:hypothetical protein